VIELFLNGRLTQKVLTGKIGQEDTNKIWHVLGIRRKDDNQAL